MSQVIAIVYDTLEAARRELDHLERAVTAGTIAITDMVIASREADGRITLTHSETISGETIAAGSFWGGLLGLAFLNPAAGSIAGAAAGEAIGAAAGEPAGDLSDYGFADDFVRSLAERVAPGKSVLLVLSEDVAIGQIGPLLGRERGELIESTMTLRADQVLRKALARGAAD